MAQPSVPCCRLQPALAWPQQLELAHPSTAAPAHGPAASLRADHAAMRSHPAGKSMLTKRIFAIDICAAKTWSVPQLCSAYIVCTMLPHPRWHDLMCRLPTLHGMRPARFSVFWTCQLCCPHLSAGIIPSVNAAHHLAAACLLQVLLYTKVQAWICTAAVMLHCSCSCRHC